MPLHEMNQPIRHTIFFGGNLSKDIAIVKHQGLDVDGDNALAPENNPNSAGKNSPVTTNTGLF